MFHRMLHARCGMVIRKLRGQRRWRIYSRKPDPKTGKRRNLGTFRSKEAALKHEAEIQYFKRRG
jgi:hypothetical protein